MRIFNNNKGIYVDAISALALSNTNVAGHHYDLHGKGYFAQLLFQRGDGSKIEENGVTTEAVLHAVLHRLETLNTLLPCAENGVAIANIQLALYALEQREQARAEQGVLGTNLPHQSVLLDITPASDDEAAQAIASGLVQDDDAPAALPAAANIPTDPANLDEPEDATQPPADQQQPTEQPDAAPKRAGKMSKA